MMKFLHAGLAVLIVSLMTISTASADENFKKPKREQIRIAQGEFDNAKGIAIGKGRLKTGFGVQGQYDSNIYRTSGDAKRDYIFTLEPKVIFDLPFGHENRHIFQAMYEGKGGIYCDHTKENYMNNAGIFNLDLDLNRGYFNAYDSIRYTTDRAGTEFTTLVKRLENTARATAGVEMGKFTLEGTFQNMVKHYTQGQYSQLSYYENTYDGTLFYQLFPKVQALIDYTFGQVRYRKNHDRNGYYNQILTGLKGDLTGKTVGIVKLGWQGRRYKTGKDYDGFIGQLATITEFTSRTKLTLSYDTKPMESVFDSSNYYIMNMVSAKLEQQLKGHFSAWVKSGISRNLYPQLSSANNIKRRDWLFNAELWLNYTIKSWGKAGIGYEYDRRNSNLDSSEYGVHLISTRFDLSF